ncbi:MAG: hypothetical protein WBD74_14855 [Candidatus Aquilonibacter sp.]
MKTTRYGRILFGAATVMFGIILLMWHDAGAWEDLPIVTLPFGAIIGDVLAIALIAGGIGIQLPRTARAASIVLGAVTILFSLACIPAIVRYPAVYFTYGSFFEFFSLVCGAIALYGATGTNAAQSATLARAARIALGVCTVSFTLAQIVYPKITADLVPIWMLPNQIFWVIVTTIAFGLAAIAMLIDRQARLATYLLALMLALFGLLVWVPILIAHPEKHFNWSEFALNYLIAGAAWLVADVTPRERNNSSQKKR